MTKETILRLLKVDSVIAFASLLPGYNGDEAVEAVSTRGLERIMELHEEYLEKFGKLETA